MKHHQKGSETPARLSVPMRMTPFRLSVGARYDVLILLVIFTLFYYFKLSTFSISIDDELAAIRHSADVWVIQGRWGVYLIGTFFVSQQVVPFFPLFIFGCCLSASYPILLSAFGVERLKAVHYVAFPLYSAFPTWIFALSFFSNTIAFGLGQLLASCALYFLRPFLISVPRKISNRSGWQQTCLEVFRVAILVATAISMYQTFVFSIVVLGLAMIMISSLEEGIEWRVALRRGAALISIIVIAIVLYEVIEILFLHVLTLDKDRYTGTLLNLPVLLNHPLHVLTLVGLSIAGVYGGGTQVFGVAAFAFPLVLGCGIAALASWPGVANSKRILLLVAAAAMLTLPFILHVTAGGEFPPRTLVPVPMVVWFFGVLGMTSPRRWLAKLSCVGVLLAAVQILYITNLLQTANEFARKHDEALAAAIYSRVVSIDPRNDLGRPLTVDFYGAKRFDSVYPRPLQSTEGYSFFEWDGGNIYRIVAYLHLLGYPQLLIPTPDQRHHNDGVFRDMPAWPEAGSVRFANSMILVKLGPLPGIR